MPDFSTILTSLTSATQNIADAQAALRALTPATTAILTADALDRAIAAANAGDVLVLDPTLVYSAPLVLTKPGLTLKSSQPPTGRMTIDYPAPKFLNGVLLQADSNLLNGLDLRQTNPLTDIVVVSGATATLLGNRILGDPTKGAKRGIAGNGPTLVVNQNYIEDCFQLSPGNDSQAFCAWDSPGPFLITDNYLSGGSETVLFGGADSLTALRMPSDIVLRGNTITKRATWQHQAIGVKNVIELKAAQRVLIEDNDVSESWAQGQTGYLLMLTVRNQGGKAPWSTVQDVVIQNNRFAHGAAALSILGLDDTPNFVSVRMARIQLLGNSFADIDHLIYGPGASDKLIQIGGGPTDVTIDSNVFAGANLGSQVYFYGAPPCVNMNITNNKWPTSAYGVFGENSSTKPGVTWAQFVTSGVLSGNVEI